MLGKNCLESELTALNTAGQDVFTDKFKQAGHKCLPWNMGCEDGDNCVAWGIPCIHKDYFGHNLCWRGNKPSVAPCNQKPVDWNHRRLCPCGGSIVVTVLKAFGAALLNLLGGSTSNSGDRNSGKSNSGERNSGKSNSGERNSDKSNSGERNSGKSNSGERNSGGGKRILQENDDEEQKSISAESVVSSPATPISEQAARFLVEEDPARFLVEDDPFCSFCASNLKDFSFESTSKLQTIFSALTVDPGNATNLLDIDNARGFLSPQHVWLASLGFSAPMGDVG